MVLSRDMTLRTFDQNFSWDKTHIPRLEFFGFLTFTDSISFERDECRQSGCRTQTIFSLEILEILLVFQVPSFR